MEQEAKGLIKDETSEKIIAAAEKIATESGEVTVRKILRELGVTNRVFYNRFHNVDEVLEIVYMNTISRIRESMSVEYDGERDFFEYVTDVVVGTLLLSYDLKMKFNRYVFEYDSVTQSNYAWYMQRIKTLFAQGKAKGAIRADVDEDALSYAIWCFCRGYNADAVERNLPKDEAVQKFRYSFSILLDGLKVK